MSKIVKGAAKVVRNIGRGLKKGFKKLMSSKFGKALTIGAAVYLGGGMLGKWALHGPLKGLQGTLVSGAGSGAATETLAQQALTQGSTPLGAGTTSAAATSQVAAPTVGAFSPSGAAPGVISGAQQAGGVAETLKAVGQKAVSAGKGALGFAKENPVATYMLANTVSGALSPDEIDMMNEEDKIRKRMLQRSYGGVNVPAFANLSSGSRSAPNSVLYPQNAPRPAGLINSARRNRNDRYY